jgi:heptosyltransferase-3
MKPIKPLPPTLKRVAVFMTDQHMGDFILAMPTIGRLAEYFENGIDLYVAAQHESLATLIPSVDRVIPYAHSKKTRKSLVQLGSFLGMLMRLPLKRYQAAFFIRARITESTFSLLTLARKRIATDSSSRLFAYNCVVQEPPFEKHEARKMASVLQAIGDSAAPRPIRLKAPDEAVRRMTTILKANHVDDLDKVAVIHPSAGLAHRCWPKERFAQVADALAESGMMIVFIGAPGEREFVEEVQSHMKLAKASFFMADALTTLLALFERADILFSNESGPTHLAAASDVPIVTVFGPTNPDQWKPVREEKMTLLSKKELCQCDDPRFCDIGWPCIMEITVEEALTALEEYL